MSLQYAALLNRALQYDGTNSAEIIDLIEEATPYLNLKEVILTSETGGVLEIEVVYWDYGPYTYSVYKTLNETDWLLPDVATNFASQAYVFTVFTDTVFSERFYIPS